MGGERKWSFDLLGISFLDRRTEPFRNVVMWCGAGWYATNSLYVVLFRNSGSRLIIIYCPGRSSSIRYRWGGEGGFDLFDVYFSRWVLEFCSGTVCPMEFNFVFPFKGRIIWASLSLTAMNYSRSKDWDKNLSISPFTSLPVHYSGLLAKIQFKITFFPFFLLNSLFIESTADSNVSPLGVRKSTPIHGPDQNPSISLLYRESSTFRRKSVFC